MLLLFVDNSVQCNVYPVHSLWNVCVTWVNKNSRLYILSLPVMAVPVYLYQ